MLIWKGAGILVPVITFFCSLLGQSASNYIAGDEYWVAHGWIAGLPFFVSAFIVWKIGKDFEANATETLINPKTMCYVTVTKDHSFFYIDMSWWGPILAFFGVLYIVNDLFLKG